METKIIKIPSLDELVKDDGVSIVENNLMVLLNQQPPTAWIRKHPMSKTDYLPIERVEYLLSRIFVKWWVDILDSKVLANSVVVTVRLNVIDPISKDVWHNDGIGAAPIQTNSGAGAMDWNAAKSDGVAKAAPGAESYAIKDAADKFGKLFGRDLGRKNQISYDSLLKETLN